MSDIIKKILDEFDEKFTITTTNKEILIADFRNGKILLAKELKNSLNKPLKKSVSRPYMSALRLYLKKKQ